jgi:hypothetical protein
MNIIRGHRDAFPIIRSLFSYFESNINGTDADDADHPKLNAKTTAIVASVVLGSLSILFVILNIIYWKKRKEEQAVKAAARRVSMSNGMQTSFCCMAPHHRRLTQYAVTGSRLSWLEPGSRISWASGIHTPTWAPGTVTPDAKYSDAFWEDALIHL